MANRYPLIVDSSTQQIKEFPSGDTLVIDNLQVTGTTTTLETATLNVEDKNITVNYSTGDSSSTADGSGLTFQDAVDASNDATILWNATNDEFDFSHGITLPDSQKITFGAGSDLEIYHDGSDSIINEAGTGVLKVRGSAGIYIQKYDGTENLASFLHDDGVYLYDGANNIRLQTTSTGIDVTGTATMDGLTVEPTAATGLTYAADGTNSYINFEANSVAASVQLYAGQSSGGYLSIGAKDSGGTLAERMRVTSTGVTVTGALLEDSNRVATNGRAIAFSLIFG